MLGNGIPYGNENLAVILLNVKIFPLYILKSSQAYPCKGSIVLFLFCFC